jgi:saccharopine dehydrogenase (NAD+, L-lysine forming)
LERNLPLFPIASSNVFSVGAELVEFDSWRSASSSTYILGLKELPENDSSPLPHTHIMFAHCYKNQGGWEEVLSRWPRGEGTLLDLEFLTDANGRRVAAFGYHAGFAGAALALQVWAWQKRTGGDGTDYPAVNPYPNESALLEQVKTQVKAGVEVNGGTWPRVIVIGALGRCGSGAVDAALKVGVPDENVLKWDLEETASGGPFPEILECTSVSQNLN